MLICEQFITIDGRTVTKYLTQKLWTVCIGGYTRRFRDELDYLRYMTEI